jgi:hypothetical protein
VTGQDHAGSVTNSAAVVHQDNTADSGNDGFDRSVDMGEGGLGAAGREVAGAGGELPDLQVGDVGG